MVVQVTAIITRVIFRCTYKSCAHVFAHDYEERNGRLVRFVTDTVSGVRYSMTPEEDADRCPKCHKRFVKFGKVVGHAGHKHCNDECLIATSAACNCSCGGINHGKAHLS